MTLISKPFPNKNTGRHFFRGNPAYVMKGTTCIYNEGNLLSRGNPAYVLKGTTSIYNEGIHFLKESRMCNERKQFYDGIQRPSTNRAYLHP